jgi:hypothetical protein
MEDQSGGVRLPQKRKGFRYLSRARAQIYEAVEGEAVLSDLSISGCRMEYDKRVDIKLHSMYIIRVLPETDKVDVFYLLAEARWIRYKGDSSEIGFKLISSPVLFSHYKQWCVKSR